MAATSLGRVCPKCWTWYVNGETFCPNCRVPLDAGDEPPAAAGPSASTAAVVEVPSPLKSWLLSLAAKGAIGLVIIVVLLTAIVLQARSHRIWSSDHSFLVIAPNGWKTPGYEKSAEPPSMGGHLLYLTDQANDGAYAEIVADRASLGLITPDHFDQLMATLPGPFRCDTPMRSTSVGGAEAMITACTTPSSSLEVVYINRYNHQYVVTLTTASGQSGRFRDDFQSILDSWGWYP